MNEIEALLNQLHDIEGLDPISSWPLALGWWVIIALLLLLIAYFTKSIQYRNSWKYDALKKLNHLSKSLSNAENIQPSAILFSEYLRRIALKKFPRNNCAGLTGQAWLQWLSENDKNNFNWMIHGQPLIHAPYAPASQDLTAEQLKTLIEAAKKWVK